MTERKEPVNWLARAKETHTKLAEKYFGMKITPELIEQLIVEAYMMGAVEQYEVMTEGQGKVPKDESEIYYERYFS